MALAQALVHRRSARARPVTTYSASTSGATLDALRSSFGRPVLQFNQHNILDAPQTIAIETMHCLMVWFDWSWTPGFFQIISDSRNLQFWKINTTMQAMSADDAEYLIRFEYY